MVEKRVPGTDPGDLSSLFVAEVQGRPLMTSFALKELGEEHLVA